jgi:serine/threonine protein kinase/tetratricopeptide (TPR) repeat protein
MLLTTGTRLGAYEILGPLGTGGMGEVYRARDTKLGREVAIKVLPAAFTDDAERRERFEREARAASALSHPNVATIYEFGESDGCAFIAMELVEGQPLDARIAGQPLETRDLVDLALQVADALEEAHGRGITHRDIKPGNLMVTSRGRVKVLDFGLARLAPRDADGDASTLMATRAGTALGTVPYMSPEQALGRDVDPRSDLFSLGAVMYEMATGRRAFDGGSASATTDLILHSQPMAIARLNYEAPAELERIIRKCLEKDRERRYQSARELVVDLGTLKRDLEFGSRDAAALAPSSGSGAVSLSPATGVTSHQGTARSSGTADDAPRSLWSRPWGAGIAVVVLGGAVALATYQWGSRHAITPKALSSIAVLPLKNLSGNAAQEWFSDGVTDSLIAELSKIKALTKVIAATSMMQLKGTNKPLPELGRELGVDVILEGSALLVGGQVRVSANLIEAATARILWSHEYDREMKDVLSLYREVARTVAGEINVALSPGERASLSDATPIAPAVQEALLKGKYFTSLITRDAENLRKALASYEEAARLDPRNAAAHAGLAMTYGALGNWGLMPQAEAALESRDSALRALAIDEGSAEAHKAICFWHFTWQHDWPLAEREMKRALELAPNDAQAHYFYALWFFVMGRFDETVAWATRAHQLAPLHLNYYQWLGDFLVAARRHDEASKAYLGILELDASNPLALRGLSQNSLTQEKYEEAWQWRVKADRATPGVTEKDLREIAEVWRVGGWPAVWREDLKDLDRSSTSLADKSGAKAAIYSLLGEADRAFAELEVAYREHSSYMWGLNDPPFDPIRRDPRFKDLLRRLNLPEK